MLLIVLLILMLTQVYCVYFNATAKFKFYKIIRFAH